MVGGMSASHRAFSPRDPAPMGEVSQACEVVAFLRDPSIYPGRPGELSVRETRTSWVFLTPRHVFKLKKRIVDEFVDFRSAEARRRNAIDEVRLNRRLAPDVYLGVVPVTRADGVLRLGGEGEAVDWLVEMRRLNQAEFLDEWALGGSLPSDRIEILADRLAAFYRAAPRAPISAGENVARFRHEILSARQGLSDPRFGLSEGRVRRIAGAQLRFLMGPADPIGRPAAMGRIVEGHGDLRPEHVWLGSDPVVIDCLEFNADLRRLDPFDELSYLSLECERLGAPHVGRLLIARVAARLKHCPPPALLAFYRSVRAFMRARFALRHLLEPAPREPAKWPHLARAYLAIAEASALQLP